VSAQERRLPGRRDDRAGPNIADRIAPPPSIGSFGLHDVHGNVAEWCRDWKLDYDRASARNGGGLLLPPPPMRPPPARGARRQRRREPGPGTRLGARRAGAARDRRGNVPAVRAQPRRYARPMLSSPMHTLTRVAVVLTAAIPLAAQSPPRTAIVATRLAGTPATQLLAADLVTGVVTPLPRFAADVLPPLAVAFDPLDDELLLAADAGGGISRVFRFTMAGGVPGNQRALGDVPGRIADLGSTEDDIVAAVGGPQGGVWRLPRGGGTSQVGFFWPYASALQTPGSGPFGTFAWSGGAGPPQAFPGLGIADLWTGQFAWGPDTPAFVSQTITGVMDMGLGWPQHLVAHGDGTLTVYSILYPALPVVVAVQPPTPPGSAVALKPWSRIGGVPIVLGGQAFPFLWTCDPSAASPPLALLAGPLPGDPVDFAIAPGDSLDLVFFGAPCGAPPMAIALTGMPTPGNAGMQFGLYAGAANAPSLFVAGFSDQQGGALPWPLPSGCWLRVWPDALAFHVTDARGTALQPFPVPNLAQLVGLRVFAQWLQANTGPFDTSGALSIRVGF
jgi:hypothetical protein